MTDVVDVYIGSDKWQQDAGAEDVLMHSIRKHATCDVRFHIMRAGGPEWPISYDGQDDSWAVGNAMRGGWETGGWATPFSNFRFCVPELNNYQGVAVYLDADMLVLGDIRELADAVPKDGCGVRAIHAYRTDVSVWRCGYFFDKAGWWPTIAEMRADPRARVVDYCRRLHAKGAMDPTLPLEWNDLDGRMFDGDAPEKVHLIHFTNVTHGQPWRPYDNVSYPTEWPYVDPSKSTTKGAQLWWQYQAEMEGAAAQGGRS